MKTRNRIFIFLVFIILVLYTYINNIIINADDSYYKYQWPLNDNINTFYIEDKVLRENYKAKILESNVDKDFHFYNEDDGYDENNCILSNNININNNLKAYSFVKKVVVAVIDTGIDIEHKDLQGKIWENVKEIPNNNIDDDNNGFIDDVHGYNFLDNNSFVYTDEYIDAHGTHIAGVIAAREKNREGIKGICGDFVKIMPLKVLGKNGNGDINDLKRAIVYAHDNGARICNISLGTRQYDEELDDLIKRYDDMLFVVAAGNGANYVGYDISVKEVYPASLNYDNVITVSNMSFDGKRYESANYGKKVAIFAPGTYVLSTLPNNQYGYITGSSIATPFVTAASALIMSIRSDISINQIKNIIIESSTKLNELYNICEAGGVLNLKEAIELALSIS